MRTHEITSELYSLSKLAAGAPLDSALQQSSLEATMLHAIVWATMSVS